MSTGNSPIGLKHHACTYRGRQGSLSIWGSQGQRSRSQAVMAKNCIPHNKSTGNIPIGLKLHACTYWVEERIPMAKNRIPHDKSARNSPKGLKHFVFAKLGKARIPIELGVTRSKVKVTGCCGQKSYFA